MSSDVSKTGNHPVRRRGTPIPVPPPRIPTPMPSNNNITRSNSKENDKHYPSSVGTDIPKLITKPSYKVLDNDVKTAWINPRLISKVINCSFPDFVVI
ncbi:hypothetical protein JTB14_002375 [Gonioctena quinquepunctata]|nr:hypothetical protein JTB14_002375 [Gonioctena quinquepunctata]